MTIKNDKLNVGGVKNDRKVKETCDLNENSIINLLEKNF